MPTSQGTEMAERMGKAFEGLNVGQMAAGPQSRTHGLERGSVFPVASAPGCCPMSADLMLAVY